MIQLPTIISDPESADADTQDDKDRGEKEAETYENVFEYLTKGCYPQGASKAEKSTPPSALLSSSCMVGRLVYLFS